MVITFAIAWVICGISGFVYWWRVEFDLTLSEVPLALLIGLFGPFSWIMGFMIHGDSSKHNKIIWRKRD